MSALLECVGCGLEDEISLTEAKTAGWVRISRYDWHEKQRQAAKAIVKAIAPDPDSPAVPF